MTFAQIKSSILKQTGKEVEIAKGNEYFYIIYRGEVVATTSLAKSYCICKSDIDMMERLMKGIDEGNNVLEVYYWIVRFPQKIKFKFNYWYYVTRKQGSTKV